MNHRQKRRAERLARFGPSRTQQRAEAASLTVAANGMGTGAYQPRPSTERSRVTWNPTATEVSQRRAGFFSRMFETMVEVGVPKEPQVPNIPLRLQEKYPADKWRLYQEAGKFIVTNLQCCGVKEIHGIQNVHMLTDMAGMGEIKHEPLLIPEIIERIQICYNGIARHRPFFLFTDNDTKRKNIGGQLADYIEANKLGTVQRSPLAHNHNSANNITVYLWNVAENFRQHKC